MYKLDLIVAREYMQRVRTRTFVIATLLGPVFMAAMLVVPALLAERSGPGVRNVVAVDLGDGKALDMVEEMLGGESGAIRVRRYDGPASNSGDVDAMRAELAPLVDEQSIDGFLVLPADFGETGEAKFFAVDPSGAVWTDSLEGVLSGVMSRMRIEEYGLSQDVLARIMVRANLTTLDLGGEGEGHKADMAARLMVSFLMVFLLYMMILMYGIQAMNGIIEDKSSRVVEVMLASVKPSTLMAGKILGSALVSLTQFVIWGLVAVGLIGQKIFELPVPVDLSFLDAGLWAYFTGFFLLGFLLFSCLYAAIGALCTSTQDAQQFQFPITMLVVIPMVMLQVILENPDSGLAMWMSLFPFFTPIIMFMRVSMGSPPFWQVALSIVLLAGAVFVMSRVAGKLFRLGILSYGKAPSWGQVIKMLRAPE